MIAYNGASDPVGGGIVFNHEEFIDAEWSFRQNSIFDNTSDGSVPNRGLGIDADMDGPDDPPDTVVTRATVAGDWIRVEGTFAVPLGFAIELFASPECDPSGFGEGKRFIGTVPHSRWQTEFDAMFPVSVALGDVITAGSKTGEFSACRTVEPATFAVVSMDPSSGAAAGNVPFTLSGIGFESGASLEIGGSEPSGLAVEAPDRITGATPPLAPGTAADAVVTNPNGSTARLPGAWVADFRDVPESHPFHGPIVRLLRDRIAAGCGEGSYCPDAALTRGELAIFLARALAGGPVEIPSSTTCGYFYSDVSTSDLFCRHVVYLRENNVTKGCGSGRFCPEAGIDRVGAAALIAKALVTPGGGPAVPQSYGPDPQTGRSYSCVGGASGIHFADVPVSDPFCRHVHFLWAKGIVDGCAETAFCPALPLARGPLAKLLARAFGRSITAR